MELAASDSIQDFAARLMDMGAIAEATLCDERGDIREVAIKFFGLGIPKGEGFPAGGIGDITAIFERMQFAMRGGVLTAIEGFADLVDGDAQSRLHDIQKAGFAHTGRPRQCGEFALQNIV